MTARRATVMLLRAVLTAPTTASPAAIVCASADLFRVPGCSRATVSIAPPKRVCFSSSRSRVAFKSSTTASASSATTISSTLIFLYSICTSPVSNSMLTQPQSTRDPKGQELGAQAVLKHPPTLWMCGCSAWLPHRLRLRLKRRPSRGPNWVAVQGFQIGILIDQILGGGLRNLLRRAFSTRVYPDLSFLGDNNALKYFGVGRLSGDALSPLNHGKLPCGLDRLDLVPSEGQVAHTITMKGDGPIGLAQQFSGEVIAI